MYKALALSQQKTMVTDSNPVPLKGHGIVGRRRRALRAMELALKNKAVTAPAPLTEPGVVNTGVTR